MLARAIASKRLRLGLGCGRLTDRSMVLRVLRLTTPELQLKRQSLDKKAVRVWAVRVWALVEVHKVWQDG